MDNQFHVNRLEAETVDWNSKEERLRKLFKPSLSIDNSLVKQKLKHFENLLLKYRNTRNLDERLTLQIIKNERNNLIKEIYPNKVVQLVYKLVNWLIVEKVKNKIHTAEELKNNKILKESLDRAGFENVFKTAERYMRLGQSKFIVPVSYYVNEKERIDQSINFTKNDQGYYQIDGFRTQLNNHSKPEENRCHYFNADEVNISQAYELLSGRSVLKDGIWKQFDFNDRNSDGNYRIKEFPQNYAFNIFEAVSKLPIKISDPSEILALSDFLKEGKRVGVNLLVHNRVGKFFIEADPQHKSLKVYTERNRQLNIGDLYGNRDTRIIKLIESESMSVKVSAGKGRTNGL